MKGLTNLRRAEREDLDQIIAWMDDPDYTHFLYGEPTQSPRQIRENIVSMLGRNESNMAPGSVHMIIDHEKAGAIGLLSLQKISWRNRSCAIDFYIGNKDFRGKIETAAAMYRLVEYCFDELNLHRISATIYAFNSPSWKFLERVGATRELVLREHVARDGELHDMYCYGLLRPDFAKFREGNAAYRAFALEDMIAKVVGEGTASESSG